MESDGLKTQRRCGVNSRSLSCCLGVFFFAFFFCGCLVLLSMDADGRSILIDVRTMTCPAGETLATCGVRVSTA